MYTVYYINHTCIYGLHMQQGIYVYALLHLKTVKVSLVPRPSGLWPGYEARGLTERLMSVMVSYKL